MKTRRIIIFLLFATSACDFNTDPISITPDIRHSKHIRNASNYIIELVRLIDGEPYSDIIYPEEEKVFQNLIYESDLPFFPTAGDTSIVIYENDISVMHTKQEVQKVSRSIMLESSYTGGRVNDKLYEIYYTFTNEDYEEAVRINEGG